MQMSRQEPQLNLNISWFLPVTNDHLFLILLQFLVQSWFKKNKKLAIYIIRMMKIKKQKDTVKKHCRKRQF